MVMMYFQVMQCLFSFSLSIALKESPGSEELVRMYLSFSRFTPSSLPMFSHFCCATLSSCTSKSNSRHKRGEFVNPKYLCYCVLYVQLPQHKLLVQW